MKERINDKIKEIEGYLKELKKITPKNLESYQSNNTIKAACERYVERIIEATTDLSLLIIKHKNLKLPEEEIKSFEILENGKIITKELSQNLRDAKGMRNILAHQYRDVNDEIIFESISKKLQKDVKEFLKVIII